MNISSIVFAMSNGSFSTSSFMMSLELVSNQYGPGLQFASK